MKRPLLRSSLLAAALAVAACTATAPETFDPVPFVNPMIGASTNTETAGAYHGLGKTFPGATTPYGLVQVNPTTITGGDNAPGYSDEHRTIEGFAMTQMSGTGWYGDLGNFLVMPTRGPLKTVAGKEKALSYTQHDGFSEAAQAVEGQDVGGLKGWRSCYDKASEQAEAGYYSVRLTDYDILAEASATPRCGILRFTFPADSCARIQVDLARRTGGTSTRQFVEILDDSTIRGWMKCPPEGGGWGNGEGHADYTVYFYAHSSKPFAATGFWNADIPDDWTRLRQDIESVRYQERVAAAAVIRGEPRWEGKHVGFFGEFPVTEGEAVEFKVGISFVDLAGAEKNYQVEMAGKDFDTVRAEARQAWNAELSRVRVSGGSEDERTIFYTALYHTMIDPRVYTDVDGRYVGGDLQVHPADPSFTKRTIFSGWDVFRSQFPLQTILHPRLVEDEINSLLTMATQSGREYLERWEFLNSYSGCMLGNPALSLIADAYAKGLRGFDAEKALQYCINSSKKFGNDSLGFTPGGLSISYTLEYAYTDWCIARLAEALGHADIAAEYRQKSQAYRQIFDPEKGWFRPRRADGSWAPWPENARTTEWYGCIECNPYQQGWFVPHDIPGMTELMGGTEKSLADLEALFEQTPEDMLWNQYYNHANEPVHLVPFLFNRLGKPWLTQQWTRFICAHAYKNQVAGIVGNEDVGQMSAWYVLSASGLHPACPGETRMEITSPVFDEVTFTLDPAYFPGGTFTVSAHDNGPQNVYIQRAVLNGRPWNDCWLDYAQVVAGGQLELWLGPEPCETWGR